MTGFIDPSVRAARAKEQRNRHPKDTHMPSSPASVEAPDILERLRKQAADIIDWHGQTMKEWDKIRGVVETHKGSDLPRLMFEGLVESLAELMTEGADEIEKQRRNVRHWREECGKLAGSHTAAATPSEPVAWVYELATRITHGPDRGQVAYDGFDRRISFDRPYVPEGAIRNLTPLYTGAAQSAPDRAAIIEECARVLDECAQDWRRIRDPGMANNAAAYAKKIRALAVTSTEGK
jgi:hypothetical protein